MLMFDNNAKTVDLSIPSLSYDNSRINSGIEENCSSMHRKQSLEIAIFYMRNAYFFRKKTPLIFSSFRKRFQQVLKNFFKVNLGLKI